MNRYYKNFILCGDIDQYCILCKESFYLIPEIEKHIRWEKHRKNVKDQTCLRHFQADLIYKIQNNYYCAICNLVMKSLTSAKRHVKSEKHQLLQKQPDAIIKKPAGQVNGGYVIIDNVIMNKPQWHSIIDNICHLCSTNITNIDEHIVTEEHIIKLIQSHTKYADKQYYRKIGSEKYHCFACKKIFTLSNFVEHWVHCENNDNEEIKRLRESRNKSIATDGGEGSSRMAGVEKELIGSLKGYFDVDDEAKKASCKNCPRRVPLSFRAMMEHMKDAHGGRNSDSSYEESSQEEAVVKAIRDSGLQRAELADYGKDVYIKMNHNGSQGYCKFCDRYISAHKSQFKLHCQGMIHQGYLEIVGLKKAKDRETTFTYTWKRLKGYLISAEPSASEPAFWINSQYCVDIYSFFFLYPIQGDPHYKLIKCHACVDVLYPDEVVAHCNSVKHRVLFTSAKFLDIDGEFIRELRPFLYHCGFCNRTLPYSKVLEEHLRTKQHIVLKEKKTLVANVVKLIRKFNPNLIDVTADDDVLYDGLMQVAGIFGPASTQF